MTYNDYFGVFLLLHLFGIAIFIHLVLRDISSVMQLCTCILSTYFSDGIIWGGWDISLRYFEGGKTMKNYVSILGV